MPSLCHTWSRQPRAPKAELSPRSRLLRWPQHAHPAVRQAVPCPCPRRGVIQHWGDWAAGTRGVDRRRGLPGRGQAEEERGLAPRCGPGRGWTRDGLRGPGRAGGPAGAAGLGARCAALLAFQGSPASLPGSPQRRQGVPGPRRRQRRQEGPGTLVCAGSAGRGLHGPGGNWRGS